MLYNKDWTCSRGKNYSEVVQKRLEKKDVVQGFLAGVLQAGDSIPWLYLRQRCFIATGKQSHGPDKATGVTDPAAVDELISAG